MEVEVKLRLPDSQAHQSLSNLLSPFHKQTHFQHNVFFDGAASELSSRRAVLRLRFYGEDCETAKRCVVSLKAKALLVDGVSRVEEDEEDIDPYWGREICADPNRVATVESRILKRVREEFGSGSVGFVCLGGFKNVRGVYEWNGLKLELDETLFDFGTLYEVECESAEPEKAKELIEEQLKRNGIPYSYSSMSKFAIFRSGKLPQTANLSGTDAVSLGTPDSISKPLWQYVTKLQKFGGGGNISFRCNICQGTYKGSYSRVKAHLLKISGLGIKPCSKATAEHLKEMKRLMDGTELRPKKAVPLDFRLPSPPSASSESSSEKKTIVGSACHEQELRVFKRRKKIGESEKALDEPVKERLDREVARMFFSAGLPFTIADNPYFKSAFTFAAKTNIADYVPPDSRYLGKTLLERERADLDKWLKPVKSLMGQKGVTIVCSGWTFPQQSLVNIMAVTGVPIFLKAVNCVAEQNNQIFISNLIKEVIVEVGPSNVVQVITENASHCREAGVLIEKVYPHVFWTPCVAHTLDLALKKICYPQNTEDNTSAYRECSWITEVVSCVKMVKDFIVNNTSSLSTVVNAEDLKLLDLNETRHGYDVALMRRFMQMKDELQSIVINEKWSLFDEDNNRENARFVKKKLLNDIFWGKIQYIMSFTEPIYDIMKVVNSGRRCLHLMHEMWFSMMMKVKEAIYYHELKESNEESMLWNALEYILQDAWTRSKNPIYALAHSLNPRYSCKQWLSEDLTRLPPHKDPEISSLRNVCLERYFPNEEDRRWVNLELVKFFESEGKLSETDSFQQRWKLDALTWWTNYGAATPSLQTLALKLLSQPCSSWCSDPSWGPKSLGHKVNDHMNPRQNKELLYVHMNLKSRALQQIHCESHTWEDSYGSSFDSDIISNLT
ncbi:hypothetical protein vseg_016462 [Gypsophila vaccaria]